MNKIVSIYGKSRSVKKQLVCGRVTIQLEQSDGTVCSPTKDIYTMKCRAALKILKQAFDVTNVVLFDRHKCGEG